VLNIENERDKLEKIVTFFNATTRRNFPLTSSVISLSRTPIITDIDKEFPLTPIPSNVLISTTPADTSSTAPVKYPLLTTNTQMLLTSTTSNVPTSIISIPGETSLSRTPVIEELSDEAIRSLSGSETSLSRTPDEEELEDLLQIALIESMAATPATEAIEDTDYIEGVSSLFEPIPASRSLSKTPHVEESQLLSEISLSRTPYLEEALDEVDEEEAVEIALKESLRTLIVDKPDEKW